MIKTLLNWIQPDLQEKLRQRSGMREKYNVRFQLSPLLPFWEGYKPRRIGCESDWLELQPPPALSGFRDKHRRQGPLPPCFLTFESKKESRNT